MVVGGFSLNLPGPDFLGIYFCLYLGALLFALVLGRNFDKPLPPEAERPTTTNPYILAYLRAGNRAVVVTALTSLYRRGEVVFAKEKVTRAPADKTRRNKHAPPDEVDRKADAESVWLEAHLLELLDKRGEPMTIAEVAAASEPELRPVKTTATRYGLVRGPDTMLRAALLSLLPMVLLFLIGLIKIGIGSERHRPVTFLALSLVVIVITAVLLVVKLPTVSRLGRALLDAAKERHHALSLTANRAISQLSIADVRLAAGVFGVAIFGNGLEALTFADQFTAAQVSTLSSSCGSSCGGGGGCGGGCGGCS